MHAVVRHPACAAQIHPYHLVPALSQDDSVLTRAAAKIQDAFGASSLASGEGLD